MKRPEVFSNLAYLVAGIVAFVLGHAVAGAALVGLALTSGWYHYTHERLPRILDRFHVVLVPVVLMYEGDMISAAALVATLAVLVYVAASLRPLDILVGIGAGVLLGYFWPASLAAGAAMLGAAVLADRAEDYDFETRAYQVLHSLWHVLSAVAVILVLRLL